jgi:hypothetical protein
MSKYIDISSAYRNRLAYPNVSDFVVEVNGTSRNTSAAAQDPILLAFPYETNLCSGGSTNTQIVLSVDASSIINFYKGSWIEINGLFRQCISYNPSTQVLTIDPTNPFPFAPPALTQYTIRYEQPVERNITGGIALDSTSIILNATSSSVDNYYTNMWVFVPGTNAPISYQWSRITAYNGTTKRATLAKAFTLLPIPGVPPVPIPAGTLYEIHRFSRDNVRPLIYQGTEIFNNPGCLKIRLVNLIVPNAYIANGYGGTLQNYPHLYVELYSEKGQTNNNTIISNSPAAERALFKIPVTYLQNNSFLALNNSFMTQSIGFRPNDTLHFTLKLPSGEPVIFNPLNPNTFAPGYNFPIPSDPLSQVQAVFEISGWSV